MKLPFNKLVTENDTGKAKAIRLSNRRMCNSSVFMIYGMDSDQSGAGGGSF